MENLEEAGYRVFLGITRYDPERERRVLESMMNFEIDALVYTLEPDYVSDLLLRCSARIPVFLTERKEAYPFHSVQFDLSEALGKTMKFLSDRKVEKVALMTNRIGFAETLFLKAGENSRMKLRVFRAESTSGDDRKFLKELSRFRPDAVIVLAGVRMEAPGTRDDLDRLLESSVSADGVRKPDPSGGEHRPSFPSVCGGALGGVAGDSAKSRRHGTSSLHFRPFSQTERAEGVPGNPSERSLFSSL